MTVAELQTACKERGMRAVGLTKEKLVNQLKQWIELSTNEKVPSSLLLLSRTLFLPETVAPAQAIEASISSLPETVATGAKAKIGEREGKIDNVTRLEIIQQEQEKIELEAKEQERIKLEKEKKALEEKAKKRTTGTGSFGASHRRTKCTDATSSSSNGRGHCEGGNINPAQGNGVSRGRTG